MVQGSCGLEEFEQEAGQEGVDMEDFAILYACEREELLRERTVYRAPLVRLRRIIVSADDCDAYTDYRVLKQDMRRLMDALGIPD